MIGHSLIYPVSVCATLCVLMPSISLSDGTVHSDEPDVIIAQSVAIEADMAAIESVLRIYNQAIRDGDQESALAQVNPDSRSRFEGLVEALGSSAKEWATNWQDVTPIDIGDEIAIYAVVQIEDGVETGYSILFVRHPKLGWLIQQM